VAKTIVITGVTRGIGRGLAGEFARLGHKVIGCGRSNDQVAELQTALGQAHDFAAVDVTDDRAVADWARRTLAEHGAPDLLINNAAIINRNANLVDVSAAEFDAVIDINIKGVANVTRHFVPAMIERDHGVIVNLSSGWGRGTSPEVAPYCATKWAMEGLSKALADELPSGMACVPLSPGMVNTEMLRSSFGAGASRMPSPRSPRRSCLRLARKTMASRSPSPAERTWPGAIGQLETVDTSLH